MSNGDAMRARRRVLGAALAAGLIAAGIGAGAPVAAGQSGGDGLGDLPINPAWLANTLGHAVDFGDVKNNTVVGAIARRDTAVS
ncbi:MAG: hypothetical protein QOD37_380, partial [Gaiellales bacterium]|nr:hypothetical protein [Gaiellales bacterium]